MGSAAEIRSLSILSPQLELRATVGGLRPPHAANALRDIDGMLFNDPLAARCAEDLAKFCCDETGLLEVSCIE